jgi:hypothetical protein
MGKMLPLGLLLSAGLIAQDKQSCTISTLVSAELTRDFIEALPKPAGHGPSIRAYGRVNLENCFGKTGVELGAWAFQNPRDGARDGLHETDFYVRIKRPLNKAGTLELSGYAGKWLYSKSMSPPKPDGKGTYDHDDVVGARILYSKNGYLALFDARKVLTSGWTADQNFAIMVAQKSFKLGKEQRTAITPGVHSSMFNNIYGYNAYPSHLGPFVEISRELKWHPGLGVNFKVQRNFPLASWVPKYTAVSGGVSYSTRR